MALLGITEYFDLAPSAVYCLRIFIALLCGGIIGAERSIRAKNAGVRIHTVLAGAAATLMTISKYAFLDLGAPAWSQGFDPTLISCFIIDGSGFLCAGIILNKSHKDTVSGMTSAANLWATAAVGMACGCGLEILGVLFTLLLLTAHTLLSARGFLSIPIRTIRMTVQNDPHIYDLMKQLQNDFGIEVVFARYARSDDEGTIQIQLQVRSKKNIHFNDTLRFLDTHPEVMNVSF